MVWKHIPTIAQMIVMKQFNNTNDTDDDEDEDEDEEVAKIVHGIINLEE